METHNDRNSRCTALTGTAALIRGELKEAAASSWALKETVL